MTVAKKMKSDVTPCLICQRIRLIKQKKNPFFVKELTTGYIVLGDRQYFSGYTLFLYKHHKTELHELPLKERTRFLIEMADVAHAVWIAFRPRKLNYELLGNTEAHLHWHIMPRHASDPEPRQPIWVIDKTIRNAPKTKPSSEKLLRLKKKLLTALNS